MPQTISKAMLDEYRGINVDDHIWWEDIYNDFKWEMECIGVDVDEIFFSISYSQGDGACFNSHIRRWDKFLPTIGIDCGAVMELATGNWFWKTEHKGNRYCHEKSVWHENNICDLDPNHHWAYERQYIELSSGYEPDSLRGKLWYEILKTADFTDIETAITQELEGHMQDLYKRLLREYEYLTSDECVADSIIEHDIHIATN